MAEPERVALVTGATAGIGLETAIGLARAGMRVIVHGRDELRTEEARYIVADRSGSNRVRRLTRATRLPRCPRSSRRCV